MASALRIFYVTGQSYHSWMQYPLAELQATGHKVTVLCPSGTAAWEQFSQHFAVKHVGLPQHLKDVRGVARAIRDLRRIYEAERPDVVYHYMIPVSYWSRIAAWLAKVPVRVYKPVSQWELSIPFYRAAEFATAWMDNLLLMTNQTLYRTYSSWAHVRGKAHLHYLGIPVSRFDPTVYVEQGRSFRREIGGDGIVVGLIAYLYPPIPALNPNVGVKGHEILMQAAREIISKYPNIRFVFVGDEPSGPNSGAYRAKLIQMASDLGLAMHCQFMGTRSDIPAVLAGLDFVVMPSLSEGLGMASVEALLMCKPVIASRVGALPDIIMDGVTGLLTRPGDPQDLAQAILKMAALSHDQREEMGHRGREMVIDRFDIRQVVEQEICFYDQILRGQR